jgi:hypothetical protein
MRNAMVYQCTLVLCLVALVTCPTIPASAFPQSKADMDPDTLKQFEKLRSDFFAAQKELDEAKKRAYKDDPLLVKAAEDVRKSHELDSKVSTNNPVYRNFLETLSAEESPLRKRLA